MSELKACPFCGGEATLKDFTGDEYCPGYAICCENKGCGMCGTPVEKINQAIKAWNRRDNTEIIRQLEALMNNLSAPYREISTCEEISNLITKLKSEGEG